MKKTDIIRRAEEIAEITKIKNFMQSPHNNIKNFGILLNSDNILKDFHERMKNDKITKGVVNKNTITRQVGLYSVNSTASADVKYMQTFTNELDVAKKQTARTVDFTVGVAGEDLKEVSMPIKEFYKNIDKGILDRFAAAAMPDFPSADYYGDKHKELFEQVREKRFCEDIAKNFNDYIYPEKVQGYYMYVSGISKNEYKEKSELEEIQNRMALKSYAQVCYEKPDETVKQVDSYIDNRRNILDDISKAIAAAAVVSQAAKVIANTEEKAVEKTTEKIFDIQPKEKTGDTAKEVICNVLKANEQAKVKSEPTAVNISDNIMNQLNMTKR